jgi:3,4-dihydroxy 2-butanone 4-phosphate synthase/GTP cyclohydrolase II
LRHLIAWDIQSKEVMMESVASPILGELQLRLEAAEADPRRPRPFVTLAYAQSLDGSIAGYGNRPLVLSSPLSLALTHELRASHHAILVGIGTVLADNPRLNVRFANGQDPQPIVVDSRLRIPRETRLLENGRKAWIAATNAAASTAEAELQSRGATVLRVRALENGWVDLPPLLEMLAARGVRHLLVEGGARILTSFLERKLVDYIVVTISPRFVGGVRTLDPRPQSSFPSLGSWRSERVGRDLVLAGELSSLIESRE